MFARHLPPSAADGPRVLALDEQAAAELAGAAVVKLAPGDLPPGPFDAVAGAADPERVSELAQRLRPGGRLVLVAPGEPAALLAALTGAGLIHCLVEPFGPVCLYRGERPPHGGSVERLQAVAAAVVRGPFVFLLVTQTPNKPVWRLRPDETVEWRAATVLDPATGEPALLAFSALVKAVAFMQPAVLAGILPKVNKVAKFAAEAARGWNLPLLLNPEFEAVRAAPAGPPMLVDPRAAITGDE